MSEYMTTGELAAMTGIPAGTLRYYRSTEQGPPSFVLGRRRVVYRRAEVEQWIVQQEQASRRGGVPA
jgi:predicted DNA-binding transcriptional regulator AlpA